MAFPELPDLELSQAGRKAPVPVGLLSGKRTPWRRVASLGTATVNRLLDKLTPRGLLHRFVQRGLQFTDVDVTLERAGPGLDGLRIAFLSDLHAGSFMSELDLCRIFARIARLEPDLVCLGGDLINTFDREILLLREPLRLLSPPLGVFAVPGNHDHFYGRDIGLWEAFLQAQGVRVLINGGERVERDGDSLWVAGVDDLTEGKPDLAAALSGHRDGEPVLLLSHHPDFFFEAAAAGVELTLAGHTHGGQVMLFGRTPLKHSKFGYWGGLYQEEEASLYVSRGVGVTFLPLRIGAPSEVPMLRCRVPAERRRSGAAEEPANVAEALHSSV
ncbi:MAG: metallophosphoesterase [Planctomycetota bacterium]